MSCLFSSYTYYIHFLSRHIIDVREVGAAFALFSDLFVPMRVPILKQCVPDRTQRALSNGILRFYLQAKLKPIKIKLLIFTMGTNQQTEYFIKIFVLPPVPHIQLISLM